MHAIDVSFHEYILCCSTFSLCFINGELFLHLFAGFIFGFRIITGTIDYWNFRLEFILLLSFIGVNLTFFPMALIRYGWNASSYSWLSWCLCVFKLYWHHMVQLYHLLVYLYLSTLLVYHYKKTGKMLLLQLIE